MDLDELVFHPWTVQGPRDVPTFVRGSGSHVIDGDGRRYLDFSSQLVFTNLATSTPHRRGPGADRRRLQPGPPAQVSNGTRLGYHPRR